ncbi:MAG: nuclear transport factor 2 family protein [Gammaproteobacteria bacterium]|jgi:hypothetical protein|nr:nuclear transport factor 2 family protein [Gammaproteobacteria bacterium]MBK7522441.1 nuclear transport factor 2 family protein [Gammaproteobacteria bacterium]MBK7728574.1 nuclear transport factor 2 family protein [Gammaproteobacteria bacterium]MBK8307977.1 nuclear transport factor 2 family protein [Gammaproteobacteria bacterium]
MIDLETLIAEREIARALAGIARAMDERNWAGIAEIMIAGASADIGTGPLASRDDIVANMRSFLDDCGPTQHLLGNLVIDVDGDEALSRCYVSDMHLGLGDKARLSFSTLGEYHDNWRKIGGRWWMVRRRKLNRAHIGDISVLGAGPDNWSG